MTSYFPNQNNNNFKKDGTIKKSINPLVVDLNKIESKFKEFNACTYSNDDLLCNFTIEESTLNCDKIQDILNSFKDKWGELIKKHRDIHTSISKFGKTTDKYFNERIDHLNSYFVKNPTSKTDGDELLEYSDVVNSLIFDYLLRIGCVDVARAFLEEETVNLSDEERCILSETSSIISSMNENDFFPLKEWIKSNKDSMTESQYIKFQYTVSKLEFLNTLSSESDSIDALINGAKQMAVFARFFQSDFEYVMGSLAFIHNPERIKHFYPELFVKIYDLSDSGIDMECGDSITSIENCTLTRNITHSFYYHHYLKELMAMFSEQVCVIKQCTKIDPLFTLFSSGIQNITEFFNHDQIFKKLYLSNKIEDLPLTVKKHNHNFHHSIFHCPVDKTVASGDNGILRLKCGHAISRSAFNQFTKNEQRPKMKCPYCPIETKTAEALKLTL